MRHMTTDEIKALLELVHAHEFAEFELEHDSFRLRIRQGGAQAVTHVLAPAATVAAPAAAPSAAAPSPVPAGPVAPAGGAPEADADLAIVKSPIVGTFYRAAEPGARPFVDVGDTVRKGQVLCIIEAMKLMNEIESELAGTIVEVTAENGKPVEYGDVLFRVKKA